ncbi:hypothetical protein C922_02772 [Plasmodium inui San Antonio 1]|uniref:Uncharacterized protein n=1 Tax=Plasmodium inui San Antonio 1 TaxID=1237626 RepID=W7A0S6_9APIC|nr:hypothetical protein C922_02772 [Plasmodium inui San Antonio 1]EUD66787.1 hypothetical protein C922_02772 [Plasmodium inui San Antonio 1]
MFRMDTTSRGDGGSDSENADSNSPPGDSRDDPISGDGNNSSDGGSQVAAEDPSHNSSDSQKEKDSSDGVSRKSEKRDPDKEELKMLSETEEESRRRKSSRTERKKKAYKKSEHYKKYFTKKGHQGDSSSRRKDTGDDSDENFFSAKKKIAKKNDDHCGRRGDQVDEENVDMSIFNDENGACSIFSRSQDGRGEGRGRNRRSGTSSSRRSPSRSSSPQSSSKSSSRRSSSRPASPSSASRSRGRREGSSGIGPSDPESAGRYRDEGSESGGSSRSGRNSRRGRRGRSRPPEEAPRLINNIKRFCSSIITKRRNEPEGISPSSALNKRKEFLLNILSNSNEINLKIGESQEKVRDVKKDKEDLMKSEKIMKNILNLGETPHADDSYYSRANFVSSMIPQGDNQTMRTSGVMNYMGGLQPTGEDDTIGTGTTTTTTYIQSAKEEELSGRMMRRSRDKGEPLHQKDKWESNKMRNISSVYDKYKILITDIKSGEYLNSIESKLNVIENSLLCMSDLQGGTDDRVDVKKKLTDLFDTAVDRLMESYEDVKKKNDAQKLHKEQLNLTCDFNLFLRLCKTMLTDQQMVYNNSKKNIIFYNNICKVNYVLGMNRNRDILFNLHCRRGYLVLSERAAQGDRSECDGSREGLHSVGLPSGGSASPRRVPHMRYDKKGVIEKLNLLWFYEQKEEAHYLHLYNLNNLNSKVMSVLIDSALDCIDVVFLNTFIPLDSFYNSMKNYYLMVVTELSFYIFNVHLYFNCEEDYNVSISEQLIYQNIYPFYFNIYLFLLFKLRKEDKKRRFHFVKSFEKNERIFLGADDGNVYEFIYEREELFKPLSIFKRIIFTTLSAVVSGVNEALFSRNRLDDHGMSGNDSYSDEQNGSFRGSYTRSYSGSASATSSARSDSPPSGTPPSRSQRSRSERTRRSTSHSGTSRSRTSRSRSRTQRTLGSSPHRSSPNRSNPQRSRSPYVAGPSPPTQHPDDEEDTLNGYNKNIYCDDIEQVPVKYHLKKIISTYFIKYFSFFKNKVRKMLVDNERSILYVLYENSDLYVKMLTNVHGGGSSRNYLSETIIFSKSDLVSEMGNIYFVDDNTSGYPDGFVGVPPGEAFYGGMAGRNVGGNHVGRGATLGGGHFGGGNLAGGNFGGGNFGSPHFGSSHFGSSHFGSSHFGGANLGNPPFGSGPPQGQPSEANRFFYPTNLEHSVLNKLSIIDMHINHLHERSNVCLKLVDNNCNIYYLSLVRSPETNSYKMVLKDFQNFPHKKGLQINDKDHRILFTHHLKNLFIVLKRRKDKVRDAGGGGGAPDIPTPNERNNRKDSTTDRQEVEGVRGADPFAQGRHMGRFPLKSDGGSINGVSGSPNLREFPEGDRRRKEGHWGRMIHGGEAGQDHYSDVGSRSSTEDDHYDHHYDSDGKGVRHAERGETGQKKRDRTSSSSPPPSSPPQPCYKLKLLTTCDEGSDPSVGSNPIQSSTSKKNKFLFRQSNEYYINEEIIAILYKKRNSNFHGFFEQSQKSNIIKDFYLDRLRHDSINRPGSKNEQNAMRIGYGGNYGGNYSGNYGGNYSGNYGDNYSGNHGGNYCGNLDPVNGPLRGEDGGQAMYYGGGPSAIGGVSGVGTPGGVSGGAPNYYDSNFLVNNNNFFFKDDGGELPRRRSIIPEQASGRLESIPPFFLNEHTVSEYHDYYDLIIITKKRIYYISQNSRTKIIEKMLNHFITHKMTSENRNIRCVLLNEMRLRGACNGDVPDGAKLDDDPFAGRSPRSIGVTVQPIAVTTAGATATTVATPGGIPPAVSNDSSHHEMAYHYYVNQIIKMVSRDEFLYVIWSLLLNHVYRYEIMCFNNVNSSGGRKMLRGSDKPEDGWYYRHGDTSMGGVNMRDYEPMTRRGDYYGQHPPYQNQKGKRKGQRVVHFEGGVNENIRAASPSAGTARRRRRRHNRRSRSNSSTSSIMGGGSEYGRMKHTGHRKIGTNQIDYDILNKIYRPTPFKFGFLDKDADYIIKQGKLQRAMELEIKTRKIKGINHLFDDTMEDLEAEEEGEASEGAGAAADQDQQGDGRMGGRSLRMLKGDPVADPSNEKVLQNNSGYYNFFNVCQKRATKEKLLEAERNRSGNFAFEYLTNKNFDIFFLKNVNMYHNSMHVLSRGLLLLLSRLLKPVMFIHLFSYERYRDTHVFKCAGRSVVGGNVGRRSADGRSADGQTSDRRRADGPRKARKVMRTAEGGREDTHVGISVISNQRNDEDEESFYNMRDFCIIRMNDEEMYAKKKRKRSWYEANDDVYILTGNVPLDCCLNLIEKLKCLNLCVSIILTTLLKKKKDFSEKMKGLTDPSIANVYSDYTILMTNEVNEFYAILNFINFSIEYLLIYSILICDYYKNKTIMRRKNIGTNQNFLYLPSTLFDLLIKCNFMKTYLSRTYRDILKQCLFNIIKSGKYIPVDFFQGYIIHKNEFLALFLIKKIEEEVYMKKKMKIKNDYGMFRSSGEPGTRGLGVGIPNGDGHAGGGSFFRGGTALGREPSALDKFDDLLASEKRAEHFIHENLKDALISIDIFKLIILLYKADYYRCASTLITLYIDAYNKKLLMEGGKKGKREKFIEKKSTPWLTQDILFCHPTGESSPYSYGSSNYSNIRRRVSSLIRNMDVEYTYDYFVLFENCFLPIEKIIHVNYTKYLLKNNEKKKKKIKTFLTTLLEYSSDINLHFFLFNLILYKCGNQFPCPISELRISPHLYYFIKLNDMNIPDAYVYYFSERKYQDMVIFYARQGFCSWGEPHPGKPTLRTLYQSEVQGRPNPGGQPGEQQKKQSEEQQKKQSEEQQKKQLEEQQKKQLEEQQKKQTEEQTKKQTDNKTGNHAEERTPREGSHPLGKKGTILGGKHKRATVKGDSGAAAPTPLGNSLPRGALHRGEANGVNQGSDGHGIHPHDGRELHTDPVGMEPTVEYDPHSSELLAELAHNNYVYENNFIGNSYLMSNPMYTHETKEIFRSIYKYLYSILSYPSLKRRIEFVECCMRAKIFIIQYSARSLKGTGLHKNTFLSEYMDVYAPGGGLSHGGKSQGSGVDDRGSERAKKKKKALHELLNTSVTFKKEVIKNYYAIDKGITYDPTFANTLKELIRKNTCFFKPKEDYLQKQSTYFLHLKEIKKCRTALNYQKLLFHEIVNLFVFYVYKFCSWDVVKNYFPVLMIGTKEDLLHVLIHLENINKEEIDIVKKSFSNMYEYLSKSKFEYRDDVITDYNYKIQNHLNGKVNLIRIVDIIDTFKEYLFTIQKCIHTKEELKDKIFFNSKFLFQNFLPSFNLLKLIILCDKKKEKIKNMNTNCFSTVNHMIRNDTSKCSSRTFSKYSFYFERLLDFAFSLSITFENINFVINYIGDVIKLNDVKFKNCLYLLVTVKLHKFMNNLFEMEKVRSLMKNKVDLLRKRQHSSVGPLHLIYFLNCVPLIYLDPQMNVILINESYEYTMNQDRIIFSKLSPFSLVSKAVNHKLRSVYSYHDYTENYTGGAEPGEGHANEGPTDEDDGTDRTSEANRPDRANRRTPAEDFLAKQIQRNSTAIDRNDRKALYHLYNVNYCFNENDYGHAARGGSNAGKGAPNSAPPAPDLIVLTYRNYCSYIVWIANLLLNHKIEYKALINVYVNIQSNIKHQRASQMEEHEIAVILYYLFTMWINGDKNNCSFFFYNEEKCFNEQNSIGCFFKDKNGQVEYINNCSLITLLKELLSRAEFYFEYTSDAASRNYDISCVILDPSIYDNEKVSKSSVDILKKFFDSIYVTFNEVMAKMPVLNHIVEFQAIQAFLKRFKLYLEEIACRITLSEGPFV